MRADQRGRQLQRRPRSGTLCRKLPAKRVGRDEVGECAPAFDLHHGQELAVAGLELGVARDLHLGELEVELRPQLRQRGSRAVAEVAAGGAVENDARCAYGYSPRVVVASATRCTARP